LLEPGTKKKTMTHMDAGSGEVDGRRLTIVLSALALFTHTLSAILLHHLPADPLNLAANFSLYSVYAAVLSALGLVGAIKVRSRDLIHFFYPNPPQHTLHPCLPGLRMAIPGKASTYS